MEQNTEKKPAFRRRRIPSENNAPKRLREYLYVQIHYQPRPSARKNHLAAVQPKLTERLHDMVHRGQLLLCGGYPTSIGGMWLLRVKSRAEAERLVRDNPAVACNLVTYRIVELQDPLGIVVQQERELPAEAAAPNGDGAA